VVRLQISMGLLSLRPVITSLPLRRASIRPVAEATRGSNATAKRPNAPAHCSRQRSAAAMSPTRVAADDRSAESPSGAFAPRRKRSTIPRRVRTREPPRRAYAPDPLGAGEACTAPTPAEERTSRPACAW